MAGQKTEEKAKSVEKVKQQADAEIWEDENSQAQQRQIFGEAMAKQDRQAARGEDDPLRCPNCGAALVLDETTGLLHI